MIFDFQEHSERWIAELSSNQHFVHETLWFDGSILIEIGQERLWLKIYRGKIIDQLNYIPVFGYSFKMTGSESAWEMLANGDRTFTDLITPGSRHLRSYEDPEIEGGGNRPAEIAIEGNGFDVGRLHIALYHLSQSFADYFKKRTKVA